MKKNLLAIAMVLGVMAGAGTASAALPTSDELMLSKPMVLASAEMLQSSSVVDEDQATVLDKKKKKKKSTKKSKRSKAGANDFGAGAGGGQWDSGGAR